MIPLSLQRCQTRRSDMEITAEIMQTYDDLSKFAIARFNHGSTLLKHKHKHKHEGRDKKV